MPPGITARHTFWTSFSLPCAHLETRKKGKEFRCTQTVENPVSARKLSLMFSEKTAHRLSTALYTPLVEKYFLLGFRKQEFD
jgi:hypothetical protein